MALTDDSKDTGLMIVATGGHNFEANAQHFSWRGMDSSRHSYMTKPLSETIVGIGYCSRGTGGASCGPATLSQYTLQAGNKSYSYTLVPFVNWLTRKRTGIAKRQL